MRGTIMKRALFAFAILVTLALPLATAMADKGDLSALKNNDDAVDIMVGKAELVTIQGNAADILVANPGIVDVMAIKSNQLYMVGNALGETNVMVLDESGNVLRRLNIHVRMDTEKLERMLVELYPDETVKIKALKDQLVLTGHVSTPSVSNSITNLAAQYAAEARGKSAANPDEVVTNMLSVAGEQQVMLKVKIVEASRSALKDLGIETSLQNSDFGNVGASVAAASALGLSAPAQLGVLALNYSSGSFGPLNFLARALEEEGIVNTLAEPNLTAISGEQAGFLAGGEIPIPTEIDRNGNLVYEFRPFGVSLNFRPIVMSANRISMQMTTEVSNASYSDNLQLQGVNVPTFNVRRADTTVELPSGGTLMIAGLLQSDTLSSLTQIPGVGKVPVVGDLLKSDSFRRNESELVVMITPYLVRPFAQNAAAVEPAPVPAKTSAADISDVPRLSMSDLETLPEEEGMPAPRAPKPSKKPNAVAMAPSAGLSDQRLIAAKEKPVSPDSKKALAQTFENNIKRTFGSSRLDSVMKESGSFGYMTD
ncbi:MAG: phospholipid-binding domain-containing protein [Micavibrio aeruginosavorus]|uniref:Phospholipid-binding domain-containing protein n=1 Tax=Micavibrio aeruginosavorus TaxID=349221 RepID=A0A2W4ZY09_9BACT|nr:MAG: phospholipid-binding domain-containing protein [Micavibrio aeruginosavorus]